MRRTLVLVLIAFMFWAPSAHAATKDINITSGPSANPADVTINGGDSVTWNNKDVTPHDVWIEGSDVSGPIPHNGSYTHSFPDPGTYDAQVGYHIDSASGPGGTITVKAAATTTTTEPTSTTTEPATTSSTTTTTSTTSTTTTTTTSTTTTSTTLPSSASGQVAISQPGSGGGGRSTVPLLIAGIVVVAILAGGSYLLWMRSGEPYDDGDDYDWTDEPPPTIQGPSI